MSTFTVACVQNAASADMDASLKAALDLTRAAEGKGADLILLPEYFSCLDVVNGLLISPPRPEGQHPALALFSEEAKSCGKWILLGSLAVEAGDGLIYNRAYLLNPKGEVSARYDKVHLFDITAPDGTVYKESAVIKPGEQAVVADTPWGGLGLSICYDLRFPKLYNTLSQAGARFLTVPAAFTKATGEPHWHVLQRARAIENACFVFSPCQTSPAGAKRPAFGHSLIIDPWGQILADGGVEPGVITARIDPGEVDRVRGLIPVIAHRREVKVAPSQSGKQAAE